MGILSIIPQPSLLDAVDDVAVTPEDTLILIDVLANDKDRNVSTLTIEYFSQPEHGIVTQSGNKLQYVPSSNYNGTDSFVYRIKNSVGETKTGTVTITVTPVNDLPIAENDTATTTSGIAIEIDVLLNDTDVDGDTLVITSVNQPTNGTAVIENGKILYTPNETFVGTDIFYYFISDGAGGVAEAKITVRVNSPE